MTKRKNKKKHWRDHLVNNLLPARFQLVQYQSLINTVVQIVQGHQVRPLDIYQRFYRSLNTKLYGSGEPRTNTPLLLKSYSIRLVSLQEEDLEQQCWLYLLELWDFHTYTWSKRGAKSTTVFYDFARAQLARWMGSYVGNQIKIANAESVDAMPLLDWYEMEDPEIFKLDLGWVVIKSEDGIFKHLTVKQKYLFYLRYNKRLTVEKISVLTQQHRAKIEKEFSLLNEIICGGHNAIARTKH